VPFAILFSAALTLLALAAPPALLVALVRAAVPRTRPSGLRLLAWEAAGGVLAVVVMTVLNLATFHRFAAIMLDGLVLAFGAGITLGAVAAAIRRLRRRRAASAVHSHPAASTPDIPPADAR
jgi:hypothetical protein